MTLLIFARYLQAIDLCTELFISEYGVSGASIMVRETGYQAHDKISFTTFLEGKRYKSCKVSITNSCKYDMHETLLYSNIL